jgi:hypothetical protein
MFQGDDGQTATREPPLSYEDDGDEPADADQRNDAYDEDIGGF